MAKTLSKDDIRELIVYSYEHILDCICYDPFALEPTENLSDPQSQSEKLNILRDLFKISMKTIDEIITRYLKDQEHTVKSHKNIKNGIDEHKIAGFLTFWISKLKPISIPPDAPKEYNMSAKQIMTINEWLAITVGCCLFYNKHGEFPELNKRFRNDLLYTLRYRINTRHQFVLIYDSLACMISD